MTTQSSKPVLFLAFANQPTHHDRHLRNLIREQIQVRQVLKKAVDTGLCELVELSSVTLKELASIFQDETYRGRIAGFHFGGHADSFQLLLNEANGSTQAALANGLTPFFASQPGLQFLFLNGCLSAPQARALTEAGIPCVIGTRSAIADELAATVAINFYGAMAAGLSLQQAWKEAAMLAQAVHEPATWYATETENQVDERGIVSKAQKEQDTFPWQIFQREGSEAAQEWNLPLAAKQPLFGLPPIEGKFNLPDEPFEFLKRYHRQDARIFFGRGKEIRDLYFRIAGAASSPVLLLHGQSGVGKSSLLEAGLLPRLEQDWDVCHLTRSHEKGLTGSLAAALGLGEPPAEPEGWLRHWKNLEADSSKKGLVVLLDQVEEVFTRPRQEEKEELEGFFQIVRLLFFDPQQRPKGKLVLSYRKEYDPEIEAACRAADMPKEKVFLQRPDGASIAEIVGGLTGSQSLRNKYNLSVEQGLAAEVAGDLLGDADSSVSVVLQIVLAQLWRRQAANPKPVFSVDAYRQLKEEGIWLEDFFRQQMQALRKEQEEPVRSGLALDVLNCHVTSHNTAKSVSVAKLTEDYAHCRNALAQLLPALQSAYLLFESERGITSLPHDALAPVVLNKVKNSTLPGQRAFRILQAKSADFEWNPAATFLDENDLALVEQGENGMRKRTEEEELLVERSRRRRAAEAAAHALNHRLKIAGVVVITLLAAAATWFWWSNFQEAKVANLVSQALQVARVDATKALDLLEQALAILPKHQGALQARHDVFSENEFYEKAWFFNAPAKNVAALSDSVFAVATGNLVIIGTASGQLLDTLSHPEDVTALAASADGQFLVTGCQDKIARRWSRDGRLAGQCTGHQTWINAVAISKDGQLMLSCDGLENMILWNQEGKEIKRFEGYAPHMVHSLAMSPTGDSLLAGCEDGQVIFWKKNGEQLHSFIHEEAVLSVAFSPKGDKVLVGTRHPDAYLWSTGGKLLTRLCGHSRRVNKVAFSSDGETLLTASDDYTARTWSLAGEPLKIYRGHSDYILDAVFQGNSGILSAGQDKSLKCWRKNSKLTGSTGRLAQSVRTLAISSDGSQVLVSQMAVEEEIWDEPANAPGKVQIWDWQSSSSRLIEGHKGNVTCFAVSPSSQLILTGSMDSTARLWRSDGTEIQRFVRHRDWVNAVAISPDGELILTGSSDSTAMLWKKDGTFLRSFRHEGLVSSVAFSPDGKMALTGCYDGIARLWRLDGTLVRSFQSGSGVETVAFSPNGTMLALGEGGTKCQFSLWQTGGNKLWEQTLDSESKVGGRSIHALAFSPDGQFIAAGALGGMVKVFHREGWALQTIREFDGSAVMSLVFSPDGTQLLTGSTDGYARIFKLANKFHQ